ncbi:SWI/SNF complex subunit SWI3B [Amborella trichopoda]|uniref:SWI/SNF complex subunit SWI3B n=1 Tax=Amborella trichopoda TaxID=13333 RepID=W1PUN3_AMBTC|nr:SWI/SNF complex subunit SWI3B [Amborella trichopoda]ERN11544.1 hypothetical protein AMTR_s00022p00147330 [Amborella trichopoda]|eukprot:XP_006849963.1 SWI/SNF complex subunit SWI3B [Amborella trichopoda]
MATETPGDVGAIKPENTPEKTLETSDSGHLPAVKPESSTFSESKERVFPITPQPLQLPFSGVVTIPSHSRWFSWDKIHDTEHRMLPEFFDGKSVSKSPRVYKYYRDFIIKKYRESPSRKITLTEVRKALVGDVGTIRRVFDFLENWGLINYTPTKQIIRWEEKEKALGGSQYAAGAIRPLGPPPGFVGASINGRIEASGKKENMRKWCTSCKLECSMVCFECQKADCITLCARCFVRGNFRLGLLVSDFKRIELNQATKTDRWTDKDTLLLLEALLQYGDDWKSVAKYVGNKSEKECISRFIKLPFGEQFVAPLELGEEELESENNAEGPTTNRSRLIPLADASNPIMAQAAFLSTLAGTEVAAAAAEAAVTALYEVDSHSNQCSERIESFHQETAHRGAAANDSLPDLESIVAEARAKLDEEEQSVEQSIASIVDVQMKEIHRKIKHFEELELQLERERAQVNHMEDLVYVEQLSFLQRSLEKEKDQNVNAVAD